MLKPTLAFAAILVASALLTPTVSQAAETNSVRVSYADLNLASICSWSKPIKYDFKPFPNAGAWLDRCLSRPAFKAAKATK